MSATLLSSIPHSIRRGSDKEIAMYIMVNGTDEQLHLLWRCISNKTLSPGRELCNQVFAAHKRIGIDAGLNARNSTVSDAVYEYKEDVDEVHITVYDDGQTLPRSVLLCQIDALNENLSKVEHKLVNINQNLTEAEQKLADTTRRHADQRNIDKTLMLDVIDKAENYCFSRDKYITYLENYCKWLEHQID